MKKRILNFIYNYPQRTLLIGITLFLACLPGLFMIQSDFTYKVWYPENDPLMQRFRDFEKNFGNDDNIIIAVESSTSLFDKKSLQAIEDLTNDIWKVEDIIRVDSLTNYDYIDFFENDINITPLYDFLEDSNFSKSSLEEVSSNLQKDPLIRGYLIDETHTMSLVVAQVVPETTKVPSSETITKEINQVVNKYKKKFPHLKFHLSGTIIITDEFRSASYKDLSLLLPILYLLFTLILIYLYRTISSVILPYLVMSTSTLMMMGLGGYLGIKLNVLTIAAPTILLTITIADAVHILTSYYLGRKDKLTDLDSVKYSLNKNFTPTSLTTITTALGFLSFMSAKIVPVSGLGLLVGLGSIVAWVTTFTLMAPILLIRAKRNIHSSNAKTTPSKKTLLSLDAQQSEKFVNTIDRHKRKIVLITLVTSVASIYLISRLKVNLDPLKQFSPTSNLVSGHNAIENKMGAASTLEIMIDSKVSDGVKNPLFLNKLQEFEVWLNSQKRIHKTLSINDFVKKTHQTLNSGDPKFHIIPQSQSLVAQEIFFYSLNLPQGRDLNNRISLDGRMTRLSLWWNISDSTTALSLIDKINIKSKELGLSAEVTGKTPLFHQLTPYLVETFATSLSFAIISITLLLMLILQSVKFGLLTLIPNVFPLLVGGSFYYFSGLMVDATTVLIASVCLGIAVDDSIHFLFEHKRLSREKMPMKKVLEKIALKTYPSLFFTTVLVCAGFSVFIFGDYIPNRNFGVMVSLILLTALISDFIILPAVILFLKIKDPDRRELKNDLTNH